jgi:8-oxo-dGTP diphosphatase
MTAAYCITCGTQLEAALAYGRERPVCPACGHVQFDDPKVAVGLVAERDGMILMTRRSHDPKLGYWSFPSGFVDAFEDVREAVAREVMEETALSATVDHLLGVYQEPGSRVIFLAFAGHAGPGEPHPGDEAFEVAFFPPDAMPEPAFHCDPAIMEAWCTWKAAQREARREADRQGDR